MLEIKCFEFGPFGTNTYVVSDEQHILLIDPACSNPYEQQMLYRYIENLTAESGPTAKRSFSETVLQRSGLSIIHTPGHTPGSICLFWEKEKVLFSGDTLFRMGYGRTDLPGGNMMQLIDSLNRLFELPDDVQIYPGHGDFSTIGAEKR